MALIGDDFVPIVATRNVRCSECGAVVYKGQTALESIRGGKVKKRVCSEACRQTFDDNYWQARANEREQHGSRR